VGSGVAAGDSTASTICWASAVGWAVMAGWQAMSSKLTTASARGIVRLVLSFDISHSFLI
jgi:hypothetical protein